MRLLLDTHVVLWLIDDPARMPDGWQEMIAGADEVHLSAVVGWEIAVKRSVGRLQAPAPEEILALLARHGYEPMPVTWTHAVGSSLLPWLHRDPFDRLLIAQAVAENLAVMTIDEQIHQYEVAVVPG